MSRFNLGMAGGVQAFEICEDYPGGEVCKEMEVQVCQPSDNEEDNLCSEVEVLVVQKYKSVSAFLQ